MNYLLHLIVFLACAIQLSLQIHLPPEFLVSNCERGYDYFSVGDLELRDDNYLKIIQQQKILVIGTLKTCLSCCKHEITFKKIQDNIKQSSELKDIKIGRIELSSNRKFQEQFKEIKRFPFLLFFDGKGGKYTFYELLDTERVIRFLKRIVTPILRFNTFSEVRDFAEREDKDAEGNKIETIKVIGLFYDGEEMEQEITQFEVTAVSLLNRSEVYFCILQDPQQVRAAKASYLEKWFDGSSLNSIVIWRGHEVVSEVLDVSELIVDMRDLKTEVTSKALRLIDEFTLENYQFYTKNAVLVAVVDSILETSATKQLLSLLEPIAKHFSHSLHVTWVEGNLNPEKKKMLGISQKAPLPQLAFFRIDSPIKLVFPTNILMFTHKNIFHFVEDYFKLSLSQMQSKYLDHTQRLLQQTLKQALSLFQNLTPENILQKLIALDISKQGQPCVLHYFVNFEGARNEQSLHEINHAARRINELFGKDSVLFFYSFQSELQESTDMQITEYISQLKPNTLYLHTGGVKPMPFKGKISARKILYFISSKIPQNKGRFPLPQYPEVPEDKLAQFFASNKTAHGIY